MNSLSTSFILRLFFACVLFFCLVKANGVELLSGLDVTERSNIDFKEEASYVSERSVITDQNAYDFLLDVDRNKELLRSESYRAALIRSLIHDGKIKDLITVDAYFFKEVGVDEYLLEILEEASKSLSELQDNNKKNLYSCLIDATTAGLKISPEEQKLWYANAYKHHLAIDQHTEEWKQTQLIGLTSRALALALGQDTEQSDKAFLQAISNIEKSRVGEDGYYLLFKYISFLAHTKAYDNLEKWLNYTLSLAEENHNAYYRTLSYYHLVLLKAKQGLPDVSAKYLREYQMSKTALNAKGLVRISFVESGYYDFASASFVKEDKGIAAFLVLVVLIVGGTIGASTYLCRNGKTSKVSVEGGRPYWSIVPQHGLEGGQYNRIEGGGTSERTEESEECISDLKKLAENNDPLFMKKFKQFFMDFAEYVGRKAETPLNSAELEVCAYTKLGYTTKEVAYYRGDSIRSVENRKYRIRRKLNLPREVDFTDWVLTA